MPMQQVWKVLSWWQSTGPSADAARHPLQRPLIAGHRAGAYMFRLAKRVSQFAQFYC